jgi:hypothetical protein
LNLELRTDVEVAKKKKRQTRWVRTFFLYICTLIFTPFIVWFLALLIWFYWNDITGQRDNTSPPQVSKKIERPTKPSEKSPRERIGEEDRKKLEEILKQK